MPRPPIVQRLIFFGSARKRETRTYALRHYGIDSWHLMDPRLIVEHYTAGTSVESALGYMAANEVHLGQLPGVCAHFIIDTDGTIYQIVPLTIMCRHVIGLNWTAIGIEHVGTSDREVLSDARQLHASLRLTLWLMSRYRIPVANVIGHAESLSSPLYRELDPSYRCQTHSDWLPTDMNLYRRDLTSLAHRYGVRTGRTTPIRVSNGCGGS